MDISEPCHTSVIQLSSIFVHYPNNKTTYRFSTANSVLDPRGYYESPLGEVEIGHCVHPGFRLQGGYHIWDLAVIDRSHGINIGGILEP